MKKLLREDNSIQFSFIIPFFNCARYLQRAIDSVLKQEGDDWELILVDDGSQDESLSLADRFTASPRIHLLHQENAGPGAARNLGVRNADGKYLWFLDCDDELLPEAIQKVRYKLQENPAIDMLIGGHLSLDPKGRKRTHHVGHLMSTGHETNFKKFLRKQLGSFSHGAVIIRREVFTRMKYAEEIHNNEDLILHAQILANYICAALPELLVLIHKRPDSLRHRISDVEQSEKITRLLFDPAILPAPLMEMEAEFRASRRLSSFRRLYLSGSKAAAKQLYQKTIREYPRAILRWSYLKKYLSLLLKSLGPQGQQSVEKDRLEPRD